MTLNVVTLENQRLTSFRLPWLLLVLVLGPGRASSCSAGPGGFQGPLLELQELGQEVLCRSPY